jgi:hypothetical protein
MSMRGVALVGGWLLGVCLATAVSWTGVRLVGDEVAPTDAGSLSQAEVERRIHASPAYPPVTLSPVTLSPVTTPPPAVTAQKSVASRGGTVVFRCDGSAITARFAPASGYAGRQAAGSDEAKIEVVFEGEARRSAVDGSCRQGTIVTTVRESDGGEED